MLNFQEELKCTSPDTQDPEFFYFFVSIKFNKAVYMI